MIQVKGLTKDYGRRRAIDNLTFHAKKGEVLGFLGPNGAGKTTTMRILSGFMPPTTGSAQIAGFDVVEDSLEVRRRIGYLPETVPLYNDMTVWEYLMYMGDLNEVEELEERVEEVLEMVHMEKRAEGYVGKLSKGMRQRIGLAQALLSSPEVLILDEPTIGLDPKQVIEVRRIIREVGREHTVMLSTHILSEAQQLCDRVLIISQGKIVASDSPAQLQARLTGAQRVQVEVKGDDDGLDRAIGKVKNVVDISQKGNGIWEFEAAPGKDARPDVARALVNNGFELLELRGLDMSLEDIFLELTREEPNPPKMASHEGSIEEDKAE